MNIKLRTLFFVLLVTFASTLVGWEKNEKIALYDKEKCITFTLRGEPVLEHLETTEAAILWMTSKKAFCWLEYRPFTLKGTKKEWKKVLVAHDGLYNAANILHRCYLPNLKPQTSYEYRIQAKQVLKLEHSATFGMAFTTKTYQFKTLSTQLAGYHFGVLNDLHLNVQAYKAHCKNAKKQGLDAMILNGDIINVIFDSSYIIDYMLKPAAPLQGSTPLYLVRGNHETRGRSARELPDFFYTPDGLSYHFLIRGDTALLITDTGEDKPDNHQEYSGLVDFDSFREKEEVWMKKVFASPSWKNAKYKIALGHIPIWQKKAESVALASREWQHRWQKLYNENGVQLVLAGHTHHQQVIKPGTNGNNYMLIISGGKKMNNNLMLTCETGNDKIVVQAWNTAQKKINNWEIPITK